MDKLTPKERSNNMRRITAKDTSPELKVRKLVYHLGYRYRLHRNDLPGKPDLCFSGKKKVIFVHGCFWHQHKDSKCKITRVPKSKTNYWLPKLKRNVERDKMNQRQLRSLGWQSLIVWECQTKDKELLSDLLENYLSSS